MIARPSAPRPAPWRLLLPPAALIAALLAAAPLPAQRILGPGPDAVTIPRGTLRIALGADHTIQRDRWSDGTLQGLGAAFSGDAFGAERLSILGPLQLAVRDLGVPDFTASFGASRLDLRQRIFVTPLSVEYGATEWLTLGVRGSLVRSKSEGAFRIRGDSGRATVGLNPLFIGSAVAGTNRATIDRYTAASANLTARRAACQSNPGAAPECPTILAELTAVGALIAGTAQFASGLTAVYGAAGLVGGRPYVPMAGSTGELALLARIDSLRTAFTRYGISDITPSTGLPLGAQAPLGTADVARLLADSTNGFGARSLDGTAITGFGDVVVSAKVKLFDAFGRGSDARFSRDRGFGVRQSVGVEGRFGTGTPAAPGDLLDLGTGTGRDALTIRSSTDVVWSDRFWTTLDVAMTQEAASTELLRVPDAPGEALLESWREAAVPVRHGRTLDATIAPRWLVNDYLALGASWRWLRKSADRHAIDATVVGPDGSSYQLAGGALDATSAFDVQQVRWHATFSTLAARVRGLDGLALEFSYSHEQAIASGSGIVPKTWVDRLQVRYYTRLFGR